MQTTPVSRPFTAKELLVKTMPFIWAKLFLRLITVLATAGLLALSIFVVSRNPAMGGGLIIVTAIIAAALNFFVVRVLGYAARVGHIAVLAETVKTGSVPANQVSYGADRVKERIGTAATFFVINKGSSPISVGNNRVKKQ